MSIDSNILFVQPRYCSYKNKSGSFKFLDLPDEIIESILARLDQYQVKNVLTLNSQMFRLAKKRLYRNLCVYNSVYGSPKNFHWFNKTIFSKALPKGIPTYISCLNFFKLMHTYSFEPELTDDLFFRLCELSETALQQIETQFKRAKSLICLDKASYVYKTYNWTQARVQGCRYIEIDLKTQTPIWAEVQSDENSYHELSSGVERSREDACYNMIYCVSLPNEMVISLARLEILVITKSYEVDFSGLDFSNLHTLTCPSHVGWKKVQMPRLRKLTVIESDNTNGIKMLLGCLALNQLEQFHCYNRNTGFENGSAEEIVGLNISLNFLESQNKSLQHALLYCDEFNRVFPDGTENRKLVYQEPDATSYQNDNVSYLKKSTKFPNLYILGLPRIKYRVKLYNNIRELTSF